MKQITIDRLKQNLRQSFFAYANMALKELAPRATTSSSKSAHLSLLHLANHAGFQDQVASLEGTDSHTGTPEYEKLLVDHGYYLEKWHPGYCQNLDEDLSPAEAIIAFKGLSPVLHFFRRSRFYIRAARGERLDIQECFELLCSLTEEPQIKITTLWACSRPDFPQKVTHCQAFEIRVFSRGELEELTRNDVNRIFYPEAEIDSGSLSRFYFLKEEHLARKVFDPWSKAQNHSSTDRALELFCLGDWDEESERVLLPQVEITFDDDLLGSPPPVFGTAKRAEEFVRYREESCISISYMMAENWEQRVEKSVRQITRVAQVLDEVDFQKREWGFLTSALRYLAKAFLTLDNDDRILWSVVVLETLFGDDKSTGTIARTIATRVQNALASTTLAQEISLRKTFTDLYDYRSQMVHGQRRSKKRQVSLRTANRMARESVIWCFEYVAYMHSRLQEMNVKEFPKRSDLLMALDYSPDELQRIRQVLENLPPSLQPRRNVQ